MRFQNRARLRFALLVVIISACSSAAPTSTPSPLITPGASVAPAGTASPDPPPSASADPAAPATSEVLIAGALERGEIDYPTSLLYRVYAAFGRPELPAEYQSSVIDSHAATFAFKEIEQHAAELPAPINAALAPYLARPNDPQSIFRQPAATVPQALALTGPLAQSAPASPLQPVDQWVKKPAAGGKALVWTPESPISDSLLDLFVAEVDRVWPTVFSLTREPLPDQPGDPLADVNPDSAIDLYFVDLGTIDPRVWACHLDPASPNCTSALSHRGGYTRDAEPRNGRVSSGYVVIDTEAIGQSANDAQGNAARPLLDANIAHELTHTSQNTYDRFEAFWLLDATATWAEYRTLQLLGLRPDPEYEYLDAFFAGLDAPLSRDVDLNRYGSWLYFMSLQLDHGDQILPPIFENMAAEGIQNAGAVDEVYSFAANFGPYAMSNWNQHTADRYRRDPTFPARLAPAPDYLAVMSPGEQKLGFETGYLSADYAIYTFSDEVRQVEIDNPFTGQVVAECNCIPAFYVIPKVKGEWKPPELFVAEHRTYCFSRAGEELEELVVIVANPDWHNLPPLVEAMMPTITAVAEDCGCDSEAVGWSGSLSFEYDGAGGGAVVHRAADVTLNFDEVYLDEPDTKTWIGEYTGGSAEERDSLSYGGPPDTVTGGPITRAKGSLNLDKPTCLFRFIFSVTIMSTYNQFDQTFEAESTIGQVKLFDVTGTDAGVSFDGAVAARLGGGEAGENELFLVSGGQIPGGYEGELEDALGQDGLGTASVQVNLTPTYP